jgi:hypothetical protein
VSFVVSKSGCGFGAIVPEFFLCKARQSRCHQGCRLPGDGACSAWSIDCFWLFRLLSEGGLVQTMQRNTSSKTLHEVTEA